MSCLFDFPASVMDSRNWLSLFFPSFFLLFSLLSPLFPFLIFFFFVRTYVTSDGVFSNLLHSSLFARMHADRHTSFLTPQFPRACLQPIRSAAGGAGAFVPAPKVFDDQEFFSFAWLEGDSARLLYVIADVDSEKRIHSRFFISHTCMYVFLRLLSRVHSFGS
jgi:hypothetical protein